MKQLARFLPEARRKVDTPGRPVAFGQRVGGRVLEMEPASQLDSLYVDLHRLWIPVGLGGVGDPVETPHPAFDFPSG